MICLIAEANLVDEKGMDNRFLALGNRLVLFFMLIVLFVGPFKDAASQC